MGQCANTETAFDPRWCAARGCMWCFLSRCACGCKLMCGMFSHAVPTPYGSTCGGPECWIFQLGFEQI